MVGEQKSKSFGEKLHASHKQIDLTVPIARRSFSHGKVVLPTRRKSAPVQARTAESYDGPFPGFSGPVAFDLRLFHSAVAAQYGERLQPARSSQPVLDVLVSCILSQNTTNTNSHAAMNSLREAFPLPGRNRLVNWDAVLASPQASLEAVIRVGGLAKTKGTRIREILQMLRENRKIISLDYLRKLDRAAVLKELKSLKGIGAKTASVVMMFALALPDFAVDTHVFRYAQQLHWVPTAEERAEQHLSNPGQKWPQITRDTTYAHLNAVMPDDLKYSMHLILTDTVNGLPVDCPARRLLRFDRENGIIFVDGQKLRSGAPKRPTSPLKKRPSSTFSTVKRPRRGSDIHERPAEL